MECNLKQAYLYKRVITLTKEHLGYPALIVSYGIGHSTANHLLHNISQETNASCLEMLYMI
jgi:hypothetical protein